MAFFAGSFFLGSFGCDTDTTRSLSRYRPESPSLAPTDAPVASIAGILGLDARALEAKTDPLPPAGDLESEIHAFTTIDACVDARAKLDPLLGDALEAIGYETFLSDACHLLDAAKSRDARRCVAIDASALRERCETTVAEVAAEPDACPWAIAGRPREGRDPACLAIALHDERLCAGALQARERTTCEAIAAHDARACGKLSDHANQAQCLRSAARWATAIAASSRMPPLASGGTLTISQTAADGIAGPIMTVDLGPDVQRGVVLVAAPGGVRFAIGLPNGDGADVIGPSPHAGASLAFAIFVPSGGGEPTIERAELRVPGHAPVATPAAHSTLRATIKKLEPTRAGALTVGVDGEMKDAMAGFRLHADLRAFVRDTVRSAELLRSGSDRGGRLGEY